MNPPYQELHIFIDETGNLPDGNKKEGKAVGGLLVMGAISENDWEELLSSLRIAVLNAGGKFPDDLHASKNKKNANFKPTSFLSILTEQITQWSGTARAVWGVAIQHKEDIWKHEEPVLAERSRDNRYQLMLYSLLEQLLFVDPAMRDYLDDRAAIYITVASRALVVPKASEPELKAFSANFRIDKKNSSNLVVPDSITSRELTTMLFEMSREFGSGPNIGLAQVKGIDYHEDKSHVGLYLADIYCYYQLRPRIVKSKSRGADWTLFPPLIREFRHLYYEPKLHTIRQAAIADRHGNFRQVLRVLGKLTDLPPPNEYLINMARHYRERALKALSAPTEGWITVVNEAIELIDKPGCLDDGLSLLKGVEDAYESSSEEVKSRLPWSTPYRIAKGYLSSANHQGDSARADALWRKISSELSKLRGRGLEGLRLEAHLRNRRAVGLMDQFRFDEAHTQLLDLIHPREASYASAAAAFNVDIESEGFKDHELGACYGTLGQVIALSRNGSPEDAANCFLRAAKLFQDPIDSDRQWIYLGHLACDGSRPNADWWNKATENLPRLADEKPIDGVTLQFQLALQLKGALVFGGTQNGKLETLLTALETALEKWPLPAQKHHPFGLIHQIAAIGASNLANVNGEATRRSASWSQFADKHFTIASQKMMKGGGTLKLLASVCRLRRLIWNAASDYQLVIEINDFIEAARAHPLKDAYGKDLNGAPTGYFGSFDRPNELTPSERAQAIISGIKFNFW